MAATKIHWIKSIDRLSYPAKCTTYCGKVGVDEGSNEWTTFGDEVRFEAQPGLRGVTCKRCQLSAQVRMRSDSSPLTHPERS